ncbi:hypothetical protein EDB89DRAFT_2162554 [Lactarius sanguifluus]|nr:hypothetical protein EDB89DRAFT_2162554 [Lactarius sanguifluus]
MASHMTTTNPPGPIDADISRSWSTPSEVTKRRRRQSLRQDYNDYNHDNCDNHNHDDYDHDYDDHDHDHWHDDDDDHDHDHYDHDDATRRDTEGDAVTMPISSEYSYSRLDASTRVSNGYSHREYELLVLTSTRTDEYESSTSGWLGLSDEYSYSAVEGGRGGGGVSSQPFLRVRGDAAGRAGPRWCALTCLLSASPSHTLIPCKWGGADKGEGAGARPMWRGGAVCPRTPPFRANGEGRGWGSRRPFRMYSTVEGGRGRAGDVGERGRRVPRAPSCAYGATRLEGRCRGQCALVHPSFRVYGEGWGRGRVPSRVSFPRVLRTPPFRANGVVWTRGQGGANVERWGGLPSLAPFPFRANGVGMGTGVTSPVPHVQGGLAKGEGEGARATCLVHPLSTRMGWCRRGGRKGPGGWAMAGIGAVVVNAGEGRSGWDLPSCAPLLRKCGGAHRVEARGARGDEERWRRRVFVCPLSAWRGIPPRERRGKEGGKGVILDPVAEANRACHVRVRGILQLGGSLPSSPIHTNRVSSHPLPSHLCCPPHTGITRKGAHKGTSPLPGPFPSSLTAALYVRARHPQPHPYPFARKGGAHEGYAALSPCRRRLRPAPLSAPPRSRRMGACKGLTERRHAKAHDLGPTPPRMRRRRGARGRTAPGTSLPAASPHTRRKGHEGHVAPSPRHPQPFPFHLPQRCTCGTGDATPIPSLPHSHGKETREGTPPRPRPSSRVAPYVREGLRGHAAPSLRRPRPLPFPLPQPCTRGKGVCGMRPPTRPFPIHAEGGAQGHAALYARKGRARARTRGMMLSFPTAPPRTCGQGARRGMPPHPGGAPFAQEGAHEAPAPLHVAQRGQRGFRLPAFTAPAPRFRTP